MDNNTQYSSRDNYTEMLNSIKEFAHDILSLDEKTIQLIREENTKLLNCKKKLAELANQNDQNLKSEIFYLELSINGIERKILSYSSFLGDTTKIKIGNELLEVLSDCEEEWKYICKDNLFRLQQLANINQRVLKINELMCNHFSSVCCICLDGLSCNCRQIESSNCTQTIKCKFLLLSLFESKLSDFTFYCSHPCNC